MTPLTTPAQVNYKQFPIRLDPRTMDELDRLAIQTRVPKTQLARDALLVMLEKMKRTGAAETMDKMFST
jgi:predicted transcriptional regulator